MSRHIHLASWLVVLAAVLLSCSQAGQGGAEPEAENIAEGDTVLVLPSVPDSLTLPQQRADYLALHYWDNMERVAPRLWRDTLFVEHAFVEFASLFPHTTNYESACNAAIAFSRTFEADSMAWRLAMWVAEQYLFYPESPVFSDMYYTPFRNLRGVSEWCSAEEHDYYMWQAKVMNLNDIGCICEDCRLDDGTMLHQALKRVSGPSLLIFHDPDCSDCNILHERLKVDGGLQYQIQTKRIQILEVNVADATPEGYILRTMPAIYLLDREGEVLLRERPYDEVREALMSAL